MHRLERRGVVSPSACEEHLATLAAAPLERHPACDLLEGAWRRRSAVRVADALSVELARALGATLLTTDPRLADAVSEIGELVPDQGGR